jgi:hypothetical protein
VTTNLNEYFGKINKTKFSKNVTYIGPMVQYSTTIKGYDRDEVYYGIRVFALSTSEINTSSFDLADDSTFQSENKNYKNFIKDNNPALTIGLNFTIGFRL